MKKLRNKSIDLIKDSTVYATVSPNKIKDKMTDGFVSFSEKLYQKLLYTGLMLVSSPAFAGFAEKDTIEAALDEVIIWLTGTIGLSAGTLAVIVAGLAGLSGRMPIAYLKTIGMSLGIIYSAAFLADMIIGPT